LPLARKRREKRLGQAFFGLRTGSYSAARFISG
jgi:hypothetical protein